MRTLGRWLRVTIGIAVTVGFVALFLRSADPGAIVATLARVSLPYLLGALAFLALDYALRIARWWWMLRASGAKVAWSACAGPFLASIAVNNVLPLRAGDALRVVGFRRTLNAPSMLVLGTVAIERLMDLVALLVAFFLGSLSIMGSAVVATLVALAGWIAGAAVAVVLVVMWFHGPLERLVSWVATRPAIARRGWSEPVSRHAGHLLATTVLLRNHRVALQLLLLSGAIWACEGAVFAVVAHAVGAEGASVGPWFAMATGTLATLLPSSPGYVGTFDYFAMTGLVAHGASPANAAGFAVAVHVVLWVPLTIVGLAYLVIPRLRRPVRGAGSNVSETKGSP